MTHLMCRALDSVKDVPSLMRLAVVVFKYCLLFGPHKTAANVYYSYYHPDHSVRDVHLSMGLVW